MLVFPHSVYKCFLLSWVRLVSVPVWAVHGTHFNASASYLACSWTLLSSFEQLAQAQLGLHLNSEVLFSLGNQVQMLFQSSIHIIWFEFKVGNPETPVYRQAPVRLNCQKPSARLITDRMITLFTAWHSTNTDGIERNMARDPRECRGWRSATYDFMALFWSLFWSIL